MENNFQELITVLEGGIPSRPVLFELFMNERIYKEAAGAAYDDSSHASSMQGRTLAFAKLGYDHVSIAGSNFDFPMAITLEKNGAQTISKNHAATIYDQESFDKYDWPTPANFNYQSLDAVAEVLPKKMKGLALSPDGLLENVINLTGYETLCIMIYDDPQLVQDIFDGVGQAMFANYKVCLEHDAVGGIFLNDDWGFNTQTMLSLSDMRKYVFPWHKRFTEQAHAYGKVAILHSCGYFGDIIEDMVDIGLDGRHSYEDNIIPVEKALDLLNGKFAVLGGIDVDFLIRAPIAEVEKRAEKLLEIAATRGGYALGSGNSIPAYVPDEKYYAMINVARKLQG